MKGIHLLLITALLSLYFHAFGVGLQVYSLRVNFDCNTPGTLYQMKVNGTEMQ